MSIKYLIGSLISIPLLPLMYFQGKRIARRVPKLPEAVGKEGCNIISGSTSRTLMVLTIGESTIAGVGVKTHSEGITGTFCKELSKLFTRSVVWKVYARNGVTAKLVVEKLIPNITEDQADIVLVGLGANDAFTLNRPSKWRKDICRLIEALKSKFPKAIIVFCNMPPIKEFPAFTTLIKFTIGNLVEILGVELKKAIIAYERVFYLDEKISLHNWISKFDSTAKKEDFFSDGVHPSKLAYQSWAKDIAISVYINDDIKNALQD